MENKYYWSFNEEQEIWDYSGETVEDCIEEARMYRKDYASEEDLEKPIETVFIGELDRFIPTINASVVIDLMIDQIWDKCGEVADVDVLQDSCNNEDGEKLEKMLSKTFNQWLQEIGYNRNFGNIVNIKEYNLESEMKK